MSKTDKLSATTRSLLILHKLVRRCLRKNSSKLQVQVPLSELNFHMRPDIFLAKEWINSQYSRSSEFVLYMDGFPRKYPNPSEMEAIFRNLYDSISNEYMYLFSPITLIEAPGGYIGKNLKRLSILMALGYVEVPCKIVKLNALSEKEKLARFRPQKRVIRILGKEKSLEVFSDITRYKDILVRRDRVV